MHHVLPAIVLASLVLAAPGARADPPPAVASLRLYALDCGRIQADDLGAYSDTGEYDGRSGTLAVPCFLVRHPEGDLLWDTGVGDALAGKPGGEKHPSGERFFLDRTLRAQLQSLDLAPKDIEYVAFSHFHYDHTGNADAFAGSTWLLSRSEVAALEAMPTALGMKPEHLRARERAEVEWIDRDRDVFGDGSVMILRAHGHTAGHQVLMLRLPKSGTVILSGDLYHTRGNFEASRMPMFNDSRAETLASFDRVRRLLESSDGRLVIQHDPGDFEALPKPPAFLE